VVLPGLCTLYHDYDKHHHNPRHYCNDDNSAMLSRHLLQAGWWRLCAVVLPRLQSLHDDDEHHDFNDYDNHNDHQFN
jgi:hypothetical protein